MFGTRRTGPGSTDAAIRVQRAGDAPSVLTVFGELSRQCDAARARRSRLGWWAAGSLFMLVFGTPAVFVGASIAAAVLADYLSDIGTLAAVVLVVGASVLSALGSLIAFIWLLVRRGNVAAVELDAAKLGIAEALLQSLVADLAPGSPVQLFVDLGGLEHGAFTPTHGSGRLYRQHWLRLEARLCDGTALRVDAMTQLKSKSRPKRRYTKTREQLIDRMVIRLSSRRGNPLPQDAATRFQRRFAYASLRLVRSSCAGGTAVLQLSSYPCSRLRSRAGWSQQGAEYRLDPAKAVGATLRAYRAVAAARA